MECQLVRAGGGDDALPRSDLLIASQNLSDNIAVLTESAIQSSPHPVFANANTPLSLVRRGVGGEVKKSISCKRELLY